MKKKEKKKQSIKHVSFKKNKYLVVRNAISKELAAFVNQCIFLKRHVITNLYENKMLETSSWYGVWNEFLVQGHYSCYGDYGAEILLNNLRPMIEKKTKKKLFPTYSFLRIYDKGAVLPHHIDRPSCEISATLNISGGIWPIYLVSNKKKIEVELEAGDLLLFKGNKFFHGRETLKNNYCTQIFLHYVEIDGWNKHLKYDKRPSIGFPRHTKLKKYKNLL